MHREEAVEYTVKHLGKLRSSEGQTGHHWRSVGCTVRHWGHGITYWRALGGPVGHIRKNWGGLRGKIDWESLKQ